MKRNTAIALLLSGMALPACAQHGGGHGGFSGHAGGGFSRSGPAMQSGFGASPSSRSGAPSVAPQNFGGRPGSAPSSRAVPNPAAAMRRGTGIRYGAQPVHYGAPGNSGAQGGRRSPYRSPYRHPDRGGIVYESPFVGPLYYGYSYGLGYDGDYGSDDDGDSQAPPYSGPEQYNGFDPGGQGQAQVWPQNPDQDSNGGQDAAQLNPGQPYRPYYGTPHSVSAPAAEPVVTLVFKDHRPNQQIHNYMINGDTLTVWDQRPHEIALGELDIAATEKLNHDAGVDLYLPGAPK